MARTERCASRNSLCLLVALLLLESISLCHGEVLGAALRHFPSVLDALPTSTNAANYARSPAATSCRSAATSLFTHAPTVPPEILTFEASWLMSASACQVVSPPPSLATQWSSWTSDVSSWLEIHSAEYTSYLAECQPWELSGAGQCPETAAPTTVSSIIDIPEPSISSEARMTLTETMANQQNGTVAATGSVVEATTTMMSSGSSLVVGSLGENAAFAACMLIFFISRAIPILDIQS